MRPIYWIILSVVLLFIEFATQGLTTVWFAGGALAAFILAAAGLGLPVQILVFVAVSIVLVIFTRPAAARWLNNRTTRTNADRVVGKEALVTKDIDNTLAKGEVQVDGVSWSARSSGNTNIPAGSRVRVKEIQGVKLIVEAI